MIARVLLLIALCVAATASQAAVLTVDLSGTASGGTGSGRLTFDDNGGGTTLTVRIDNTSPNVLDAGTGQNSSIITGWGFSMTPDLPTIQSWSVIAGNGVNISSKYNVTEDGSLTGYGGGGRFNLEEITQTSNGIKGGIYNAASPGNTANTFPDVAIFTLTFCAPFSLQSLDVATLRMQRVGTNGAGSLKLLGYAAQQHAVPEPGTFLMLLGGVVGVFCVRVNKKAGMSCARKLQPV